MLLYLSRLFYFILVTKYNLKKVLLTCNEVHILSCIYTFENVPVIVSTMVNVAGMSCSLVAIQPIKTPLLLIYSTLTNIDTWLIVTCCNLASVITILHLSELETGGVRHLGHQITSPPEQRRVVLLVCKYINTIFTTIETNM